MVRILSAATAFVLLQPTAWAFVAPNHVVGISRSTQRLSTPSPLSVSTTTANETMMTVDIAKPNESTPVKKEEKELSPQGQALEIIHGNWQAQALKAFVTTGISKVMGEGIKETHGIAKAVNLNPIATYRLLRYLATFDVVVEGENKKFALGPVGEVCVPDTPGSVAGVLAWEGGKTVADVWNLLPEFLKMNERVVEQAFEGQDIWGHFGDNPQALKVFQEAMTEYSNESGMFITTPPLSPTLECLAQYDTICDLGCAEGALALALNQRFPDSNYILADLPFAVDRINDKDLPDNFSKEPTNFLEAVPKADAYVLKYIIHDWDNDHASTILKNIYKANPKARVFVAEFGPMPGPNVPHPAKGFDLQMGLFFSASERTQQEYDELWESNGWERLNTHMLADGDYPMYIQEIEFKGE